MMQSELIWQADLQQRVFRDLVESFSRPGEVRSLANRNTSASTLIAVLATLIDGDTTLADPHAQIAALDWPLLQVRKAPPDSAHYILADGQRAPDFQPVLGTLASPESGATIVLKVSALGRGPVCLRLSGPGIAQQSELHVMGLHMAWLQQRANWVAGFPLGVDMILCSATQIAALPRTTRVSMTTMTEGAT